jgi:hypothetical protein
MRALLTTKKKAGGRYATDLILATAGSQVRFRRISRQRLPRDG